MINTPLSLNRINYPKTIVKKDVAAINTAKERLSKILFGSNSSDITFGWSRHVKKTQEELLNTIIDPSIKTAVVMTHKIPDGDAYGSNMGVCGILESLGIKTISVIDGNHVMPLANMPSPDKTKPAHEYSVSTNKAIEILEQKNIKLIDLVIVTDCSDPTRLTDDNYKLLSLAKKVVIIDHHKDSKNALPNKTTWINKLMEINKNLKADDIKYWGDNNKSSASEMIAKLDHEIYIEHKFSHKIPQYKVDRDRTYRLSMAVGILTDSGLRATDPARGKQKFYRTSRLNYYLESVKKTFEWLVENSGKASTNLKQFIESQINNKNVYYLEKLAQGKRQVEGLTEQNLSGQRSNISILRLNRSAVDTICSTVKETEPHLTDNEIINFLKSKFISRNRQGNFNKNTISMIVNDYEAPGDKFFISLRSNNKQSEPLAKHLEASGLGKGGGHPDASGFVSHSGIDFDCVIPFIKDFLSFNKKA